MKYRVVLAASLLLAVRVSAQDPHAASQPTPAPQAERLQVRTGADRAAVLTRRGAQFLVAAQAADGGWMLEKGPGVTCLALRALIQEPTIGPRHPAVLRGIEAVKKSVRPDGGIYSAEGMLKNYESSVALSMFAALEQGRAAQPASAPAADAASSVAKEIAALQKFLKDNQWTEEQGKSVDDPWYGGAGYGNGKRPDLSNTQMMLEALHDSGLPPDDPAFKKALVFIQRCQMLGESNDQPFAKGSTQGGFIYSPANGGESKAGEVEVSGRQELRAYGTMTYAGFKSMLYAGLKHDDPRVKAAVDWISHYWTLDFNPNMPDARSREGLYYYYHVFGCALAAWGEDTIGAKGQMHEWRQELVERLASLQHPDGSWVNDRDRWMEGAPALTTAYAMLSLEAAFPQTPAAPRSSETLPSTQQPVRD